MSDVVAKGWMLDGLTSMTFVWVWTGLVIVYALWRSLHRPTPDPIRSAGPIERERRFAGKDG